MSSFQNILRNNGDVNGDKNYIIIMSWRGLDTILVLNYNKFISIENSTPDLPFEDTIIVLNRIDGDLHNHSINDVVADQTIKQVWRKKYQYVYDKKVYNMPEEEEPSNSLLYFRLQLLMILDKQGQLYNHRGSISFVVTEDEEDATIKLKQVYKEFKFCKVCKIKTIKMCKCKLAYYCCGDCQKQDWKQHKSLCKESI